MGKISDTFEFVILHHTHRSPVHNVIVVSIHCVQLG